MPVEIERNLGEQPIARIMAERGLKARDLVTVSTEQITHKMVARACKAKVDPARADQDPQRLESGYGPEVFRGSNCLPIDNINKEHILLDEIPADVIERMTLA